MSDGLVATSSLVSMGNRQECQDGRQGRHGRIFVITAVYGGGAMGLRACINSCIVVAFGNEGSKMSSLSNHVPHHHHLIAWTDAEQARARSYCN
jgi:hypothetical protein